MSTDTLIKRLEDARDRAWAIAEHSLEALETGVPSKQNDRFTDEELLDMDKHLYTHWNGFARGFDYAINIIKGNWGLNSSLRCYHPIKYGTHPRLAGIKWRKDFGQL